MTASNARLMLPAVAGNPGAVYFDLANGGDRDMMMSGAKVDGAQSAMMHVTEPSGMLEILQIMVKAGETVKFAEGGNHVMAVGLPDTLKPGDMANVTVHFVGGDELTFPATVHAAGDR
jgi:copper(I)-binding protein